MFARLLWRIVCGSRGRLAVAFVAIVSGAAVISALLSLQGGVEAKFSEQFRLLGANIEISRHSGDLSAFGVADASPSVPALAGSPELMDQGAILSPIEQVRDRSVVAAAPFLYVVTRVNRIVVVTAGTWLDELPRLNPTWKIKRSASITGYNDADCLIGRNAARQFHVEPGQGIELRYSGNASRLRVAGVVDAGGEEDNQVFVSLPLVQRLAGLSGKIQLVELSVSGPLPRIGEYASRLRVSLPGCEVRPIAKVTLAEGQLMNRIRFLIVGTVVLILLLTVLCVLATMAALAMERREDVGLMKALGASISSVVGLFLAEVAVVGAVGGVVGCGVGLILSRWIGERVFEAAISPRWTAFPVTTALMISAAFAGALPLRLLGRVKPAVILRGE